jgi:hypothetical protein
MSGSPRMEMPSASPPPRLVTCTPETRCRASTTLLSGSLPMSSATIDSITWVASRLFSRPLARLSRIPVTTTVSTSSPLGVSAAGACCASAETENVSAATADAVRIRIIPATLVPPLTNGLVIGSACPFVLLLGQMLAAGHSPVQCPRCHRSIIRLICVLRPGKVTTNTRTYGVPGRLEAFSFVETANPPTNAGQAGARKKQWFQRVSAFDR